MVGAGGLAPDGPSLNGLPALLLSHQRRHPHIVALRDHFLTEAPAAGRPVEIALRRTQIPFCSGQLRARHSWCLRIRMFTLQPFHDDAGTGTRQTSSNFLRRDSSSFSVMDRYGSYQHPSIHIACFQGFLARLPLGGWASDGRPWQELILAPGRPKDPAVRVF